MKCSTQQLVHHEDDHWGFIVSGFIYKDIFQRGTEVVLVVQIECSINNTHALDSAEGGHGPQKPQNGAFVEVCRQVWLRESLTARGGGKLPLLFLFMVTEKGGLPLQLSHSMDADEKVTGMDALTLPVGGTVLVLAWLKNPLSMLSRVPAGTMLLSHSMLNRVVSPLCASSITSVIVHACMKGNSAKDR